MILFLNRVFEDVFRLNQVTHRSGMILSSNMPGKLMRIKGTGIQEDLSRQEQILDQVIATHETLKTVRSLQKMMRILGTLSTWKSLKQWLSICVMTPLGCISDIYIGIH